MNERSLGGIALAGCVAAGSTFNTFAKHLRSSLSALSLLFLSELFTGFFVLFTFGALSVFRSMTRVSRRDAPWLLGMALLSGVCGPYLLFSGLHYTTAINAGFFSKSEMIFMLLLARIVLGERWTRNHAYAIVAVIVGMMIISLEGFSSQLALRTGDMIIVASAACYSVGNIIFRTKLKNVDPHIALFGRSVVAVSVFFILSPLIAQPFISELHAFPLSLLPALLGFAFLSRFLNSVLYFFSLDRIPVTSVSLVGTLDIVGATAFAYIYLHEPVAWYHIAGGAFIIAGSLLLESESIRHGVWHRERHLKQRIP